MSETGTSGLGLNGAGSNGAGVSGPGMGRAGPDAYLLAENPLRPGPSGSKRLLAAAIQAALPTIFAIARRSGRIPHLGKTYLVTR